MTLPALQPYFEHKDPGIAWMGKIPAHWGTIKTKYLLRERSEKGFPNEPLLAATQTKGVVRKEAYENRTVLALKDLHLLKLVRRGDFVISLRSFQGGIEQAREQGIISPAYTVLCPIDESTSGYLARLFKSAPYIQNLTSYVTGIRQGQNIDYERLSRSFLPVPAIGEQLAIASFLDHFDRRINRLIRAKRRLIELLNEQKQAIIQRAVTRGLDPNVRLRPSGVDWLGDVPEHWLLLALKRVLRQLVDCEHHTAPAVESSEYRVIRTSAVRNGQLRIAGTYCTTSEGYRQWTRRVTPKAGDVVFTREAPAGEACVIPPGQQLCLGQRTVLMAVDEDRYDARFLVHTIYGGPPAERIKLASQGSTVDHFNLDDIAALPILAPPLCEQIAIVAYIEEAIRPIEVAENRAEREIRLLREYRTRLIADVVTGKLDVRDVNLPAHDVDEAADELSIEADAGTLEEDTGEESEPT